MGTINYGHDDEITRIALQTRLCGEAAGHGVYLGAGSDGWVWARPQHAVLIIGPPRSGKTTGIVVPAILAASGPVVSTSTKADVMEATRRVRAEIGRCLLFDPTGCVESPQGVRRLHWSPLDSAHDWDRALATAHALVTTIGPPGRSADTHHWVERAESLLAPLLHAASISHRSLSDVITWVNRHEEKEPLDLLEGSGAGIPADLLYGITVTDHREKSGIFSTASEILAPYRGSAALASAGPVAQESASPDDDSYAGRSGGAVRLDPDAFVRSSDTIYVCAPGRRQALVAPLIVALLDEIRAAAYALADMEARAQRPGSTRGCGAVGLENAGRVVNQPSTRPPVFFALDELANIAPIPDLPALVSEGGGQGVTTLACIQDLSQARQRWGVAADGFFTLFGAKVVMPGIGDVRTVESLSRLSGNVNVATKSVTSPRAWSPLGQGSSETWSPGERNYLPPDAIARGEPGSALYFDGVERPVRIRTTPCFAAEPWRTLTSSQHRYRQLHHQGERSFGPAIASERSNLADE